MRKRINHFIQASMENCCQVQSVSFYCNHENHTAVDVVFQALISKGLYVHVVRAMKQHDKVPEVQQWGCRALRGLSLSGCGHKELMINCGVLELVFSCTQRYSTHC